MQLKTGYSITDLRTDLAGLYLKAGLKSIGITFVMTDSHVADERFLVLINDMLAFGEISELFADEEVDNIVNGVRNEVISNLKKDETKFFGKGQPVLVIKLVLFINISIFVMEDLLSLLFV